MQEYEMFSKLFNDNQYDAEVDKIINEIKKYDIYDIIAKLSSLNLFSENQNKSILIDYVIAKIIEQKPSNNNYCLFLDRIRDPGNLGTILRTAVACGFNDVYCYSCVDLYNPKVVRSSMSAILKLNVIESNEEVLSRLNEYGYEILCADMNGENIFDCSFLDKKVCLIIGNEANGVSDTVLSKSTKTISLPMQNIESLNAGVCASVMMYQIKYNK